MPETLCRSTTASSKSGKAAPALSMATARDAEKMAIAASSQSSAAFQSYLRRAGPKQDRGCKRSAALLAGNFAGLQITCCAVVNPPR